MPDSCALVTYHFYLAHLAYQSFTRSPTEQCYIREMQAEFSTQKVIQIEPIELKRKVKASSVDTALGLSIKWQWHKDVTNDGFHSSKRS